MRRLQPILRFNSSLCLSGYPQTMLLKRCPQNMSSEKTEIYKSFPSVHSAPFTQHPTYLAGLQLPNLLTQQTSTATMYPDYPSTITTLEEKAAYDALWADPRELTKMSAEELKTRHPRERKRWAAEDVYSQHFMHFTISELTAFNRINTGKRRFQGT